MKKYFLVLLVLFSAVCGIYADSDYDPFDKLAEKLLDDFEDDGSTIVVKVFNSDLGNNERKRISKSVQFALYCTNEIEKYIQVDATGMLWYGGTCENIEVMEADEAICKGNSEQPTIKLIKEFEIASFGISNF